MIAAAAKFSSSKQERFYQESRTQEGMDEFYEEGWEMWVAGFIDRHRFGGRYSEPLERYGAEVASQFPIRSWTCRRFVEEKKVGLPVVALAVFDTRGQALDRLDRLIDIVDRDAVVGGSVKNQDGFAFPSKLECVGQEEGGCRAPGR
ncbi:MAG: hypothetical protein U1F77_20025 [Kiritimatiellia bacterium]